MSEPRHTLPTAASEQHDRHSADRAQDVQEARALARFPREVASRHKVAGPAPRREDASDGFAWPPTAEDLDAFEVILLDGQRPPGSTATNRDEATKAAARYPDRADLRQIGHGPQGEATRPSLERPASTRTLAIGSSAAAPAVAAGRLQSDVPRRPPQPPHPITRPSREPVEKAAPAREASPAVPLARPEQRSLRRLGPVAAVVALGALVGLGGVRWAPHARAFIDRLSIRWGASLDESRVSSRSDPIAGRAIAQSTATSGQIGKDTPLASGNLPGTPISVPTSGAAIVEREARDVSRVEAKPVAPAEPVRVDLKPASLPDVAIAPRIDRVAKQTAMSNPPTDVSEPPPASKIKEVVPPTPTEPEPPPARPPTPVAASPLAAGELRTVPSLGHEETEIQEALREYQMAYEHLNAAAAKAVWPSVDQKALARAFNGLASQELVFDACELDVRGVTATASCRGSASYIPKVGDKDRQVEPRRWNFELRKDGQAWKIEKAEVRKAGG